jgi:hypothetical protein
MQSLKKTVDKEKTASPVVSQKKGLTRTANQKAPEDQSDTYSADQD